MYEAKKTVVDWLVTRFCKQVLQLHPCLV